MKMLVPLLLDFFPGQRETCLDVTAVKIDPLFLQKGSYLLLHGVDVFTINKVNKCVVLHSLHIRNVTVTCGSVE